MAFLRRDLESVCGLGWWGDGCAGRREAKKMEMERGGEETRDWMRMAHVMCLFSISASLALHTLGNLDSWIRHLFLWFSVGTSEGLLAT